METAWSFIAGAGHLGTAAVLWAWDWVCYGLAPLFTLSIAVLLPALLALAVVLVVIVALLWWVHGRMVQLGEGPHETAFTHACALTTRAALGVAEASAEIESALYLPAVTIAHRLQSGVWTSKAVCKVFIEQVCIFASELVALYHKYSTQLVESNQAANAVTYQRFAAAMWEAVYADACTKLGLYPVYGMASAGDILPDVISGSGPPVLPGTWGKTSWLQARLECTPPLQAVRSAVARVAQRHADEGFPWTSQRPVFWGVPCSIKECFAAKDMPRSGTSGLLSRQGVGSSRDAPTVHRMRAAGFIALANTNTSELCMWYESSNRLHGRTGNMYHPGRMVGGSSGGEACLVSGAGAPVGLGSDVGGSIRLPAHFNGVWGHKPSGGLVPNMGQYPAVDSPILCTGPLTRHAVDLWPMMRLLAGPPRADAAAALAAALPGQVTLSAAAAAGVPCARPIHGPTAALHPSSKSHVTFASDGGWSLPLRTRGLHNGFLPHDPSQDTGAEMLQRMTEQRSAAAVGQMTLADAASAFLGGVPRAKSAPPLPVLDVSVAGNGSMMRLQATLHGRMKVFVPRAEDLKHPLRLTSPMEPFVQASMDRCAAAAAAITGAEVCTLELPEMSSAFDLWSALLRAEGGHMFKELLGDEPNYRSFSMLQTLRQLFASALFDWAHGEGHPAQRVEQEPVPSDARLSRPSAALLQEADPQLHDPFGSRRRAEVLAGTHPAPEAHRVHKGMTPEERVAYHPAPYTFPGLGLVVIEELPQTLMPSFVEASRIRGLQLRRRLDSTLGRNGVLVVPVQPTTAQAHNVPMWSFLNVGYTMLFNATLNPVTVVPCGLDEDGLPCGMQLVGARGSDVTTIAVGVLLEAMQRDDGEGSASAFGWVPPKVLTDMHPPPAGLVQQ